MTSLDRPQIAMRSVSNTVGKFRVHVAPHRFWLSVAGRLLAFDAAGCSRCSLEQVNHQRVTLQRPYLPGRVMRAAAIIVKTGIPSMIATAIAAPVFAQSAREIRGPTPLIEIENEAPPQLIVDGLPPGPHKVLIELACQTHKVVDRHEVRFVVPQPQNAMPGK